jgi:hypothetical protein
MFLREPQNIAPLPKASFMSTVAGKLKDLGGAVAGPILGAVVGLAGKNGVEETWKEWPKMKKGFVGDLMADMKIASIRNWMNANTLKSTEEPGQLVNGQQPGQKRPEWTTRFRTATGAWTTDDPSEGSAGARIAWQGKSPIAEVRRDRSLDADLPSVREVSRAFLVSNGEQKKAPFLNNLAIAWIQFELHDWVNHRQADTSEHQAIKVELAKDDPIRKRYGQDAMYFRQTQPDVKPTKGMQTYRSEVTAWWDGSQIYGSDQATQDKLRMGKDGKMLADGKLRLDDGQLPVDEQGRELSGFTRNWWAGLSMFHTLFAKNHNAICDKIKAGHPTWSSDQIFNTARMVNAAIMAKIHTVEWTPAVLPTKTLAVGMNTNWNGIIDTMTNVFKDRKALSGVDVTDPVLGGLVGGKRNGLGVPYNFGEQFSEVYRLHAGFLQDLLVRQIGHAEPVAKIEADATREQGAQAVSKKFGMSTLINSLGYEKMAALVNNNYPEFFSELSVEGSPVMDLGAADILRACERGVPPYNESPARAPADREVRGPRRGQGDLSQAQEDVRRRSRRRGQARPLGRHAVRRRPPADGLRTDAVRGVHPVRLGPPDAGPLVLQREVQRAVLHQGRHRAHRQSQPQGHHARALSRAGAVWPGRREQRLRALELHGRVCPRRAPPDVDRRREVLSELRIIRRYRHGKRTRAPAPRQNDQTRRDRRRRPGLRRQERRWKDRQERADQFVPKGRPARRGRLRRSVLRRQGPGHRLPGRLGGLQWLAHQGRAQGVRRRRHAHAAQPPPGALGLLRRQRRRQDRHGRELQELAGPRLQHAEVGHADRGLHGGLRRPSLERDEGGSGLDE